MYQAQLGDSAQMDLQAAQRIVRQGQPQTVRIYRVMMDTLADKLVLQRQVNRAGGWLQRRFNPRDVKHILCIPEPEEQPPAASQPHNQ